MTVDRAYVLCEDARTVSVVAGKAESVRWPVVAALTCGHFMTYDVEHVPVLHAHVRCALCAAADFPSWHSVRATVSVGDLIEHSDRLIEAQRIAREQIAPDSETPVNFEPGTAAEALVVQEFKRLHEALGVRW